MKTFLYRVLCACTVCVLHISCSRPLANKVPSSEKQETVTTETKQMTRVSVTTASQSVVLQATKTPLAEQPSLEVSHRLSTTQFGKGVPSEGDIPISYSFRLKDQSVLVTYSESGQIKVTGGLTLNVALALKDGAWIEGLQYAEVDQTLFLAYTFSTSNSGGSVALAIDLVKQSPVWQIQVGGFNLGDAVIREHYIYLSTIGTVAKLDFIAGKFVWKHDNLYDATTGAFNSMKVAQFDGTKVVFEDEFESTKKIVVDDETGKLDHNTQIP